MNPVRFPQSNLVMSAPPGMDNCSEFYSAGVEDMKQKLAHGEKCLELLLKGYEYDAEPPPAIARGLNLRLPNSGVCSRVAGFATRRPKCRVFGSETELDPSFRKTGRNTA